MTTPKPPPSETDLPIAAPAFDDEPLSTELAAQDEAKAKAANKKLVDALGAELNVETWWLAAVKAAKRWDSETQVTREEFTAALEETKGLKVKGA